MVRIKKVFNRSIAYQNGIKSGDKIISINSNIINDELDYQFYSVDEKINIELMNNEGKKYSVVINKDYGEDIGIELSDMKIKVCANKCIFCFVDQLPRKLRPSLYLKDDDYRYSFLYGNYITLTNLTSYDMEKIVKLHLSPLYISVHTVDADLREFMLKNPASRDIMKQIRFFIDNGIKLHTQAVILPEVNDGRYLRETIETLADLRPNIESLAIVPVGLSKFRNNLFNARLFTKKEAINVIDMVNQYNEKFRKENGKSFVYAADEFFVIAERDIPSAEYYDDFEQLENGIGMLREELDDFEYFFGKYLADIQVNKIEHPLHIITGVSAYKYISNIYDKINTHLDMQLFYVHKIKNEFLGDSITVSGLLTGSDIMNQIHKDIKGIIFLPPNMINYDNLTIDNYAISDIADNFSNARTFIFSQEEIWDYLRNPDLNFD